MKSYTATALSIAFKIWFVAVVVNTAGNTVLFGSMGPFMVNAILLIALFGSLFSAPVFLVLWGLLYNLLHAGKQVSFIFKILLFTGIGFGLVTWAVFAYIFSFFDKVLMYMAAIAPVSGAIAICAAYPNIKKACHTRDENNTLPEFDAAQTTAG